MTSVISDKYAALGGPSGILGDPVSDEEIRADGRSHLRRYKNGSIYSLWTPVPSTPSEPLSVERAFAVQGPMHEKWKSLGFDAGLLGTVTTDERPFNDGVSRFHFFERGAIAWNATAGAQSAATGQADQRLAAIFASSVR